MNKILLILLFLTAESFCFSIPLNIRESSGISRKNELVSNGIPLSRNSNITDVDEIQLKDNVGNPIPAQFEVLSRWGGSLNSVNPIQWLLVSFPVDVGDNETKTYLLESGTNPMHPAPLEINETTNSYSINTHVAKFYINKNKLSIFDSVHTTTPDGGFQKILGSSGGTLSIKLSEFSTLMIAQAPDNISIEREGPVTATIKFEGSFNNPPYADIPWRYSMRYTFYTGSSNVDVELYFNFPGNKNGTTRIDATSRENYVKIENVGITLPVESMNVNEAFVSATGSVKETMALSDTSQLISIKQKLKPRLFATPQYEMVTDEVTLNNGYLEKPAIVVSGSNGRVGVSIKKMMMYEPQSIVADMKKITISVVADSQLIGPFMGAFANISFSVANLESDVETLAGSMLNSQDHKIFIWPYREYVAHTTIFDEIWDGKSNPEAELYWSKLTGTTNKTKEKVLEYGLTGFMTYGLLPRAWYKDNFHEFGDTLQPFGYFLGAKFTDYHNCFSNVVRQFAQDPDANLLNDIALPAAKRMLNTQIIQDHSSNSVNTAGWSPIGYGGYRTDYNSSHSYFENLYYYYYLTGDNKVVDVLSKAGRYIRNIYRNDPSRGTVDRMHSQFAAIVWFLGHATNDSTIFTEYIEYYGRLIDRNTALLVHNDKEYAFSSEDLVQEADGSLQTEQTWIWAVYCMQNLWNTYNEFGDISLGKNEITLSRYFNATLNTYLDYVATAYQNSDGSPSSNWANSLVVDWSGSKFGGTVQNVTYYQRQEPHLWLTGKSTLPLFMLRAASMNNNQEAFNKVVALVRYLINQIPGDLVWNKETALYFLRLNGCIGYLTSGMVEDYSTDVKYEIVEKKDISKKKLYMPNEKEIIYLLNGRAVQRSDISSKISNLYLIKKGTDCKNKILINNSY
jgi:hypothetical protein